MYNRMSVAYHQHQTVFSRIAIWWAVEWANKFEEGGNLTLMAFQTQIRGAITLLVNVRIITSCCCGDV